MDQAKVNHAVEKEEIGPSAADFRGLVETEQNSSAAPADVTDLSRGRSTGPRTESGKKISSKNALKLGFFARELKTLHMSCEEDRQEFERLFESLIDSWEPVGQSELIQIELMAIALHQYKCLLRLERVRRANFRTDILDGVLGNSREDDPKLEAWRHELPHLDDLEKFQRCETHILRNYYRAMCELQRLQEMRLGKRVLPRLYMDVNAQ